MNDLELLHDAWGAPDAPSDAARARARSALLARAVPRYRRRLVPRLAAAAALVLIVAAGLAAVRDIGPGPETVPNASAAVLERAAVAAEGKPFTPPRDDQWIYIEDRITSSDGGEPMIRRRWRAVDGTGMAAVADDGKLRVERVRSGKGRPLRAVVGPFAAYETLAALPTDPDALRRWAYRQGETITGAGLTEDGDVYAIFSGILSDNVLPPELEAAIFRALKQVPGVTVDRIDVGGRRALLVGQTEDWLREEFLLDAETYTYLGQSGTVVRDAIIDPAKAGNDTGAIEQGHQVVAERLTTAIVDEPGQRP
jgi:hypothetical protein